MGKQFSLLATDADLEGLEGLLRHFGDVALLSCIATADLRGLLPLAQLAIPISQAGKTTVFCHLAPNEKQRKIVVEPDSGVKVHIDLVESHLIEFWRPFFDGTLMRRGRLYYEPRLFIAGMFINKDEAFCRWANRVMNRVRKALTYDPRLLAHVGKDAARAIATGEVTVVN